MSHSTHAATHNYAGIAANGVKTVDGAKLQSYADCEAFWNAHESSMEKVRDGVWRMRIGSNVYLVSYWTPKVNAGDLFTDHEKFAVQIYSTEIVYYWPDETFMTTLGPVDTDFDDGRQIGVTPTTVSRINQFTPDHSWYHRYKWRLHGYGAETRVPVSRD
jgi:hypothetical protein